MPTKVETQIDTVQFILKEDGSVWLRGKVFDYDTREWRSIERPVSRGEPK